MLVDVEHQFSRPRLEASTQGSLQRGRRAPRDHLTPVDDGDLVGEREQEFHVVLDDDDGEVPFSLPISSASRTRPSLPSPAVGSSRNSSFGLARERHADLQRAARAVGQCLGVVVGAVGKSDLGENVMRFIAPAAGSA